MKYMNKLVDLDTGKPLWVDLGEHRTLSEVSDMFGIGYRTFRQVLLAMDLLQREWDTRAQRHRNRLAPWAVNSRLGMRHDRHAFERDSARTPFDVLSPEGVEYIQDHLEETYKKMKAPSPDLLKARAQLKEADSRRVRPMDAEGQVGWLTAHCPNLTPKDIAAIAEVSDSLVRRYIDRREAQLARAVAAQNGPVRFVVRGVPADEIETASPPTPRLPPVAKVEPYSDAEIRQVWPREEEKQSVPLWGPDRLRKSPKPLWNQTGGHRDENLLEVA